MQCYVMLRDAMLCFVICSYLLGRTFVAFRKRYQKVKHRSPSGFFFCMINLEWWKQLSRFLELLFPIPRIQNEFVNKIALFKMLNRFGSYRYLATSFPKCHLLSLLFTVCLKLVFSSSVFVLCWDWVNSTGRILPSCSKMCQAILFCFLPFIIWINSIFVCEARCVL